MSLPTEKPDVYSLLKKKRQLTPAQRAALAKATAARAAKRTAEKGVIVIKPKPTCAEKEVAQKKKRAAEAKKKQAARKQLTQEQRNEINRKARERYAAKKGKPKVPKKTPAQIRVEKAIPYNLAKPVLVRGEEAQIAKLVAKGKATEITHDEATKFSVKLKDKLTPEETKIVVETVLKERLPKDYPYSAQALAYIMRGVDKGEARMDKVAKIIHTDAERAQYIIKLIDKLTGYNGGLITNVYVTIYRDNELQPLIKVANSFEGNCLLNIIANSGYDVTPIYKKFPHLRPNGDELVYINAKEVKEVSKILRKSIVVYSALGIKIGKIWEQHTRGKNAKISVVFSNEHATIAANRIRISKVVYEDIDVLPRTVDVADYDYHQKYPEILRYYTTISEGKFTLHKSFRPSSITGREEDDSNPNYNYAADPSQLLYAIFKEKYGLGPIKDSQIRNVIKSAEHFTGCRRFCEIPEQALEIDKNMCYASYKEVAGYIGFPSGDFIPSFYPSTNNEIKTLFV